MAARLEVYKCLACGNIVEVLTGGIGQLVCCGQPMNLLDEKHLFVPESLYSSHHLLMV